MATNWRVNDAGHDHLLSKRLTLDPATHEVGRMPPPGEITTRHARCIYAAAGLILAVHIALVARGALRHSPCIDEVAHLPSGVSHWRTGSFGLYKVNPPLVRSIATIPTVLWGPQVSWIGWFDAPLARPEWAIGRGFIDTYGKEAFWHFTLARWFCIPFTVLGAVTCFIWAKRLYSPGAGLLALTLWCLCPNIIANAQMITPDVGVTAVGLTASFLYWRWLCDSTWARAICAGLLLGLTALAKFTGLILFAVWPLLWLISKRESRKHAYFAHPTRDLLQLGVILLIAIYVINLGYGFEGSFTPLKEFRFVSSAFAGQRKDIDQAGNRFAGTLAGELPVPLPKFYLLGIDFIKYEFEIRYNSFLAGEWRLGGWWYYYLYALAIKVPLGTWGLLIIAAAHTVVHGRSLVTHVRDEAALMLPAAAILASVSSQTGFNHHLRYVLPILPFLFVWSSKVARCIEWNRKFASALVCLSIGWGAISSLWVYPHSMSYFNEIVSGPSNGHLHLIDSNVDWGQDLFYLQEWVEAHPQAQPLGLVGRFRYDPSTVGIEWYSPNTWPPSSSRSFGTNPKAQGPEPGWFAISVVALHTPPEIEIINGTETRHRAAGFDYFGFFEPVDRIGYSMHIYHVSLEECNALRGKLGLVPLPSGWRRLRAEE